MEKNDNRYACFCGKRYKHEGYRNKHQRTCEPYLAASAQMEKVIKLTHYSFDNLRAYFTVYFEDEGPNGEPVKPHWVPALRLYITTWEMDRLVYLQEFMVWFQLKLRDPRIIKIASRLAEANQSLRWYQADDEMLNIMDYALREWELSMRVDNKLMESE